MGLEPEAIGHQAVGIHRTGIGERRRCWGRPCTMNDLIGRYEEIVSCRTMWLQSFGIMSIHVQHRILLQFGGYFSRLLQVDIETLLHQARAVLWQIEQSGILVEAPQSGLFTQNDRGQR